MSGWAAVASGYALAVGVWVVLVLVAARSRHR